MGTAPGERLERDALTRAAGPVAGLDEVGRGAWAGPASVGVVVYSPDAAPAGIRDSKLLAEARREALFPRVVAWSPASAVGHASPTECDALGMTAALRLAARRALDGLPEMPATLLVDGGFDFVSPPGPDGEAAGGGPPRPQVVTVVRGDAACVSIAAASIVAKVTRDRMMRSFAPSFPPFDFDRNKGYPSPVHRTALAGHGLSSLHRRSWSYVGDLAFR